MYIRQLNTRLSPIDIANWSVVCRNLHHQQDGVSIRFSNLIQLTVVRRNGVGAVFCRMLQILRTGDITN